MGLWMAVAVCGSGWREKRGDSRGGSKRGLVTHFAVLPYPSSQGITSQGSLSGAHVSVPCL